MRATEPFYIDLGDGVKREIVFTLSTLRRLKKLTGKSFMSGEAVASLDEDIIPFMIEQALVEKNMTADQIADMILLPDLAGIVNQLFAAYIGSMPEANETERKN